MKFYWKFLVTFTSSSSLHMWQNNFCYDLFWSKHECRFNAEIGSSIFCSLCELHYLLPLSSFGFIFLSFFSKQDIIWGSRSFGQDVIACNFRKDLFYFHLIFLFLPAFPHAGSLKCHFFFFCLQCFCSLLQVVTNVHFTQSYLLLDIYD